MQSNVLSDSSTKLVQKTIKAIGLKKAHADIYLSLLELGPSSAAQIAKKADIPRSSSYDLLSDLIDEGLVSKSKSETRTIFAPASPEQLSLTLKQKSLQYSHNLELFETSLSELMRFFANSHPDFPSVQFFSGKKGLKTALYDSLSANEVLAVCQGSSEVQKNLDSDPDYLKDYFREFFRRKIKSRELLENTPAGQEYCQKFNSQNNQIKLMPKRTDDSFGHVDKLIYDNKIAYISHDNLTAVIVEDQTIASHERILFEKLWIVDFLNQTT